MSATTLDAEARGHRFFRAPLRSSRTDRDKYFHPQILDFYHLAYYQYVNYFRASARTSIVPRSAAEKPYARRFCRLRRPRSSIWRAVLWRSLEYIHGRRRPCGVRAPNFRPLWRERSHAKGHSARSRHNPASIDAAITCAQIRPKTAFRYNRSLDQRA